MHTKQNVNENNRTGFVSEQTSGPIESDAAAEQTSANRTTNSATQASDPFNPANLRLPQDFGANLKVQNAILTVPVRKPGKEQWIQTHPDPSYRIDAGVIELKEDREMYLVTPHLISELATESTFGSRTIITAINTVGVVFLWPLRLPGPDGKIDDWSRSALEISVMAQNKWVRVQSNMSLGAYEVLTSNNDKPAIWPTVSFAELLRIAFRDRLINSLDHPVIKKLRGVS